MKLRRLLKILLLVVCIVLTGFLSFFMYIVFFDESTPFEYGMLIPVFMALTGVLSVAYHIKTLKFYSVKTKLLYFKDLVLWVANALFAIALILAALYLAYKLYLVYEVKPNNQIYIAYLIVFLMFVLGVCLILEAKNLYSRIQKSTTDVFKASIDDIGGDIQNEL